jgi:hypothetical protein
MVSGTAQATRSGTYSFWRWYPAKVCRATPPDSMLRGRAPYAGERRPAAPAISIRNGTEPEGGIAAVSCCCPTTLPWAGSLPSAHAPTARRVASGWSLSTTCTRGRATAVAPRLLRVPVTVTSCPGPAIAGEMLDTLISRVVPAAEAPV